MTHTFERLFINYQIRTNSGDNCVCSFQVEDVDFPNHEFVHGQSHTKQNPSDLKEVLIHIRTRYIAIGLQ